MTVTAPWCNCTSEKVCQFHHPHRCTALDKPAARSPDGRCRNLATPVPGHPFLCYLHGGPRWRLIGPARERVVIREQEE